MRDLFKRLFGGNKTQEPAQLVSTRRPRGSRGIPFGGEWHSFESRSGLYRYMRSRIPIVSSAIWHWVRLCNTPGSFQFTGRDSHTREAEQVVGELVGRIHSAAGVKRRVLGSLLELFFMEIFTNGSFSGRLVPLPSGKGIDYFEDIDADDIEWTRRGKWVAGLRKDDTVTALPEETFFHYGLGADRFNPRGVSFLSTVEFVTAIEQRMVDDMSRSSHNAGNPHLHIKISPPERFENESETRYVKRAEQYFDDTVRMFREIDPDDNIFSWSDLEITVIGGEQAMPQSWRVNREQVIEDVITGMKLFPWVVGRSHGTTKNWVQAQYNLLMQVVDSIQEEGRAFAEWIVQTELNLRNLPVKAEYIFSPNQDPYQLDREKASSIKFETVDKKVRRGYISKDDGARELGYGEAFQNDT